MRINFLEEKVRHVLEKYPDTRNDDVQLTFFIIHEYMPDQMQQIDGQWWVSTEALKRIREDNVKRIRARIQNEEHEFLPTVESVRNQRKIREEEWLAYTRKGDK